MTVREFLNRLDGAEGKGHGTWQACCPLHSDAVQRLSIGVRNGRIKLNCSAGCSTFKIVQGMGLTLADLFTDNAQKEEIPAGNYSAEEWLALRGGETKQKSGKDGSEPKEIQPLTVTTAPDLQKANLPPIRYLVEGTLPEGTSLLTAASKIGKSWMVLDLGLCSAAGERFLGHGTHQCGVNPILKRSGLSYALCEKTMLRI